MSASRAMTGERLRPGVWDGIPADVYHQDPCAEPSLSAGIAHKLISKSALHAQAAHPRLNPDHEEEVASNLDFGQAAHALLLQGIDICEEVKGFDDWRKKEARDARDSARHSGLIPLLTNDYDRMCELVETVKQRTAQLDVHPLPLRDGKPEQTLVWKEGGVWCRARIDWLHDTGDVIDDLKTTGTSANPRLWCKRRLFEDGKDIQAVFYLRGLRALTGQDAIWRFVVVEVEPPYALSVVTLSPAARELAERKVTRALTVWKAALQSGDWPGYQRDVYEADPPPWDEAEFIEAHWEPEEIAA